MGAKGTQLDTVGNGPGSDSDQLERAILDELAELETMHPDRWAPRDEQIEHAAEIVGPRLFRFAA